VSWPVERRAGLAGELHARPLGAGGRLVELLEVHRPAVVLGSRQSLDEVDATAAASGGVDVVRRRSGGGGVLLTPAGQAWIDVTIGRDDPLWHDDVGISFAWLGAAWATALAGFGLRPVVHEGRLITTAWSRTVCFAGLGPGEVTVYGSKLVGISQRRTRDGARFQCLVHRRWDPAALLGLLALDEGVRATAAAELAAVAIGLDRPSEQVLGSLVAALPA
jgi:lipoate-protein ligase A